MNTAPTAGVIMNPVPKVIPAAIGMAKALYPVAQIRFCTILE